MGSGNPLSTKLSELVIFASQYFDIDNFLSFSAADYRLSHDFLIIVMLQGPCDLDENYIDPKNECREATNPPFFPKNMVSFLSKLIITGNNACFGFQNLFLIWRDVKGEGVLTNRNYAREFKSPCNNH